MAENTVVHIGENSPEQIAYKLWTELNTFGRPANPTRKWFLDVYAECLRAVRDPVGQAARSARE